MYFTDEIILVSYERIKNDRGEWDKTRKETRCFCNLLSATGKETFDYGQTGVKVFGTAEMRSCDYSGQEEAVVNGRELKIYRTYNQGGTKLRYRAVANPDMIELHLCEKGGVTSG